MARNTFWDADIIHHDESDRMETIGIHASGLPSDPNKVVEFLKTHNYRNKNVTIQNVKPSTGEISGHPFIGQANNNLFNAAGQQVNERHEKVISPPPPPTPQVK